MHQCALCNPNDGIRNWVFNIEYSNGSQCDVNRLYDGFVEIMRNEMNLKLKSKVKIMLQTIFSLILYFQFYQNYCLHSNLTKFESNFSTCLKVLSELSVIEPSSSVTSFGIFNCLKYSL
jgi:hypothetical protein